LVVTKKPSARSATRDHLARGELMIAALATAINLQGFGSGPIRPFADTNSVENGSPRDFSNRIHFAHFDVNLRKPILE
jgi:hypothetical protein